MYVLREIATSVLSSSSSLPSLLSLLSPARFSQASLSLSLLFSVLLVFSSLSRDFVSPALFSPLHPFYQRLQPTSRREQACRFTYAIEKLPPISIATTVLKVSFLSFFLFPFPFVLRKSSQVERLPRRTLLPN